MHHDICLQNVKKNLGLPVYNSLLRDKVNTSKTAQIILLVG